MRQYIERALANDALIDSGLYGKVLEKAVKAICSVPAAYVRPVVRGEWLYDKYDIFPYCSECLKQENGRSNYCPNCGADMGVGKRNENK